MRIEILILLCIVQGLTEFLPVSSSGHLFLLEKIFGIDNNILLLNLFFHLASLLAVLFFYRKIIFNLIKKPFQPLTYKLIISTIITVIIALLYDYFNFGRYEYHILGYCFIITSILLFLTYLFQKNTLSIKTGEISYKNSILAGIIQGIAVIPGISRSGSTISSLILSGNTETESSEYSFLLSIPIIIGGFTYELLKIDNFTNLFATISPLMLIIAFFITFITALLALKLTIKLLKNNKFIYFSIYLLILGLVVIFTL